MRSVECRFVRTTSYQHELEAMSKTTVGRKRHTDASDPKISKKAKTVGSPAAKSTKWSPPSTKAVFDEQENELDEFSEDAGASGDIAEDEDAKIHPSRKETVLNGKWH